MQKWDFLWRGEVRRWAHGVRLRRTFDREQQPYHEEYLRGMRQPTTVGTLINILAYRENSCINDMLILLSSLYLIIMHLSNNDRKLKEIIKNWKMVDKQMNNIHAKLLWIYLISLLTIKI